MGAPRWKLVAPVAAGLVSVSVAAGVLVTAVSPASATGGLCASYPGSGSGTAGDPYLVSTATELAALDACANAGQTSGAYFKQTAPISLAGYANWDPIGTGNSSGTRFSGIYDGGCFAIDGLTITSSGADYNGLFSALGGAIAKNILMTNVSVATGRGRTGGLAGNVSGTTVKNVSISGSVSGSSQVGLLSGAVTTGTGTTFTKVKVAGTSTGTFDVGGVAANTPTQGASLIFATANVTGVDAAGVIADSNLGGISNSLATGTATVQDPAAKAGGFVQLFRNDLGQITTSYARGAVSSLDPNPNALGGLAATAFTSPPVFASSYWDAQTTGQASSAGNTANARTTTQMMGAGTFNDWDTTIWNITDGSYPSLIWFDQVPSGCGFEIIYDANGGSGPPTGRGYDRASTVTVAAAGSMAKSGNTFTGWNTLADGTGTAYAACPHLVSRRTPGSMPSGRPAPR